MIEILYILAMYSAKYFKTALAIFSILEAACTALFFWTATPAWLPITIGSLLLVLAIMVFIVYVVFDVLDDIK